MKGEDKEFTFEGTERCRSRSVGENRSYFDRHIETGCNGAGEHGVYFQENIEMGISCMAWRSIKLTSFVAWRNWWTSLNSTLSRKGYWQGWKSQNFEREGAHT